MYPWTSLDVHHHYLNVSTSARLRLPSASLLHIEMSLSGTVFIQTRVTPIGRVSYLKFYFQISTLHIPIKPMNRSRSTLVYSPPHRWDVRLCKKRPTPCLPPSNAFTDSRHVWRDSTSTLNIIILYSYLIPRRSSLISVKRRFKRFYTGQSTCLCTTTFESISLAQITFRPTSLLFGQHYSQYNDFSPSLCSQPRSPTLNGP